VRAWIITRDLLTERNGPEDSDESEVGTMGPFGITHDAVRRLQQGEGYKFSMYDDDGIEYYRGRLIFDDSEDLETAVYGPLGDFGAPNAGCVRIDYPNHPEWNCA
jgi:hypothetical protein